MQACPEKRHTFPSPGGQLLKIALKKLVTFSRFTHVLVKLVVRHHFRQRAAGSWNRQRAYWDGKHRAAVSGLKRMSLPLSFSARSTSVSKERSQSSKMCIRPCIGKIQDAAIRKNQARNAPVFLPRNVPMPNEPLWLARLLDESQS